jgi:hypothetical protein
MPENNSLHVLSESEFQLQAEPFLNRIFTEKCCFDDGFGESFTPELTSRIILYPLELHGIVDCLPAQNLVNAACAIEDTGCYIFPWWDGPSSYCYVPLSEFVEGYDGEPGSETLIGLRLGINVYSAVSTIISASGRWGIYTSSEHFALLGGSSEFMAAIRQEVLGIDNQVYEFLAYWRHVRNVDLQQGNDYGPYRWLPVMLKNIYGEERGTQLLNESGLPWE